MDHRQPALVLTEVHDPVERSRAHTALGQRAFAQQNLDLALEHLREASDLDPTDEVPRKLLAQIDERRPSRRRWFGWMARRVR